MPPIYVDDALLAAIGKARMMKMLAAIIKIEAIFVVMGRPQNEVRQCHLAMDKWDKMLIFQEQIML